MHKFIMFQSVNIYGLFYFLSMTCNCSGEFACLLYSSSEFLLRWNFHCRVCESCVF